MLRSLIVFCVLSAGLLAQANPGDINVYTCAGKGTVKGPGQWNLEVSYRSPKWPFARLSHNGQSVVFYMNGGGDQSTMSCRINSSPNPSDIKVARCSSPDSVDMYTADLALDASGQVKATITRINDDGFNEVAKGISCAAASN